MSIVPRLFSSFWHYLAIMLLVSCVTEQLPEGGPPDETPPKLVRSFPENGALNFKDRKIRVTFNKNIAVEDIYNKLLVMPKLDKPENKQPYNYFINGKTLELKLNSPLKADTTYSIHFNDVVKDKREGTKATDVVLTFSTGSFIDPITAKGKTKDLLTDKLVGGVNVYLYSAERDPKEWQEKGIPDYYGVSDKDGNFTIDRIRLGKYYIRATTGKNSKYEIDYENDKYGFFKDPIDLNDSQDAIVLPLITADVRDFKLLRSSSQKGFFEIAFNKAIEKYQLTALQTIGVKGKPQLYSLLSDKSPKTVFLYNTFGLLAGENFKVKLIAEDTMHMVLEESLSIHFKEGREDVTKSGLAVSLAPRALPSVLSTFTESVLFSKPIKEIKQELIYFACKDQKRIALKEDELEWNSNRTKLTIKKNFSQEEMMQFLTEEKERQDTSKVVKQVVVLLVEAGACTAFDKAKNKEIKISYPIRNEEETGTIAGNIDTSISYFIIELLDGNDKVVDSIRNKKDYQFTMIPPGTYKMRILVLNEGEDSWSPGNIRKNIEPSPVIFYEKDITVVAKWDVTGIDFKF